MNEVLILETSRKSRVYPVIPKGIYQAVMVDYVFNPKVEKQYPGKPVTFQPEIKFIFQLNAEVMKEDLLPNANGAELSEDDLKQVGSRFLLYTRDFNAKVSYFNDTKKTEITSFLRSLRGGDIPDNEIPKFNVAGLLGINATIVVDHYHGKKDPSKTYNIIAGISGWSERSGALIQPKDYVRLKDRKKEADKTPTSPAAVAKIPPPDKAQVPDSAYEKYLM